MRREHLRGFGRKQRMMVPLEHEEQASLMDWALKFQRSYPELKMLFAIPNQGAARLKNLQTEGVMRGVPDLMLAVARGDSHGLFIELKRRKGGRPSMDQYRWLAELDAQGYAIAICYGWDDARETILRYLEGRDARDRITATPVARTEPGVRS